MTVVVVWVEIVFTLILNHILYLLLPQHLLELDLLMCVFNLTLFICLSYLDEFNFASQFVDDATLLEEDLLHLNDPLLESYLHDNQLVLRRIFEQLEDLLHFLGI